MHNKHNSSIGRKKVYAQYRIPLDLFNKPSYLIGAGIALLAIAWLIFMFYIAQFGDWGELAGFLMLIFIFVIFFAIVGKYGYRDANRWVLRNVKCPICNGAIEKSECDITGRPGVMHCIIYCRNCKRKFFLGREKLSNVFNLSDYSQAEYSDLIDSNAPGGI